jgi:transposase
MEYHNPNVSPNLAEKLTAIERMFITMRSNGSSIRDIAKKLRKSTNTISSWNRKFDRHIIALRNYEFCDLQKKIIESKSIRLKILKNELEKISAVMQNFKFDSEQSDWEYKEILSTFVQLSNLMTDCEFDLLTVGVKYKDNNESELYPHEVEGNPDNDVINVIKSDNKITQNPPLETADNNTFKQGERQNRNKLLHKFKKKRY